MEPPSQSSNLDAPKEDFGCSKAEKSVLSTSMLSSVHGSSSKNVRFSTVVVYSFAREQGFSSVPDTGWCSLGMSQKHQAVSRFDVHHHQLLQRLRRRRERLSQKSRLPGSSAHIAMRLKGRLRGGLKATVTQREPLRLSPGDSCRVPSFPSPPPLSPQTFTETLTRVDPSYSAFFGNPGVQSTPPPPCLSPPSPRRVLGHFDESLAASNSLVIPEGFDTDSEASLDQVPSIKPGRNAKPRRGRSKLLPIHGAARIRILKESGVTRLDETERDVCLRIRATRGRVGCDCGPRYPCTPGRCSCIDEGVQCQVDRPSFPCSCSAASCHNPNGRAEFSQEQVRSHVQNILQRLASEQENDGAPPGRPLLSNGNVNAQWNSPSLLQGAQKPGYEKSPKTDNELPRPTPELRHVLKASMQVTPNRTCAAQKPSPRMAKQSLRWLSSTPAPPENVVRKVLFQDVCVPDQFSLDASVSLSRLRSPEITAKYGSVSALRKPSIADSSSTEPESSNEAPVTTPPGFRSKKLGYLNANKRKCRTPVPRKRTWNNARQLLSKSMNAITIPVDGEDCISLNSSGNIRLPTEPTDWLSEVTAPSLAPFVAPTSPGGCSPVRLTWDLRDEATELQPGSPLGNTNHLLSVPLSSPDQIGLHREGMPITDVSVSAPSTSPVERGALKSPVRNYATYRIRGSPFASKSAPNSPCSLGTPSLGRLSLRRRAIPRLPVTPSRRAARTPNARLGSNAARKFPSQSVVACPLSGHTDQESTPSCIPAVQPHTPEHQPQLTPKTNCATSSQTMAILPLTATLPPFSSSS